MIFNVNDKITFRLPDYRTERIIGHSDLFLQFIFIGSCIEIDYCSEDDRILCHIIREELTEIAAGVLAIETFEAIQERALKVLLEFIDDAE